MVTIYTEMNPVRARMVAHLEEYGWSGCAANALGHSNPLLTPHELCLNIARNLDERQQIYRQLFMHKSEPHIVACPRSATAGGGA